ncbi:hypothetical protein [uncultured Duncaniella sp.]|uniref:hypothetical protein n=1 Tax=uncultured Duncaniella sp. TaxID=2768039 RepID=UPI00266F94FA|nr:hypothetical protein [uncultured Duncaniella sp.]
MTYLSLRWCKDIYYFTNAKIFLENKCEINTYGAYCILYDKNMRHENPHRFRPEDQIKTGEQENRNFRPEDYKDRRTGEQFREKKYRIKKYGSIVLWSESSPVLLSL